MLLPSVRQRIDALCARWRTLERPAQVAVATIGLLYVAVACVGIYYGPKRYFDCTCRSCYCVSLYRY